MKYLLLPLVILNVACAPASEKSCNFMQSSDKQRISWKTNKPIELRINHTVTDEYIPGIKRAMNQWHKASGKTLFKLNEERVPNKIVKDGINVISLEKLEWPTDKPNTLAVTRMNAIGDLIRETDMFFNLFKYGFYSNDEILHLGNSMIHFDSLVIHELGHVLGLNHVNDEKSVMYPYLSPLTEKTEIIEETINDLNCEY